MAKLPGFTIWTDAYLADTTHLSEAEHGRYLLLLIHLWRAPQQRFPNEDGWLARKFGRDENWVREHLRPLISEFCFCDGNWITQKRLSKEFRYVSLQRQKQTERSKSRWEKEKSLSRGNATTATSAAYAPTPTPTPTKKDQECNASGTTDLSGVEELGIRARNGAPCAPADAPATGTPTALPVEQKPEPKKTGLGNGSGNYRTNPDTPEGRQWRELQAELAREAPR